MRHFVLGRDREKVKKSESPCDSSVGLNPQAVS